LRLPRSSFPLLITCLGLFALLLGGCKTSFPSYDADQPFKRSSMSKDSLMQILRGDAPQQPLFPLYAKGKLQVRQGERSERGSLELYAYDDSLYAKVKNQVGIAGLEVWMIGERLIIRDRVERETYRYAIEDVPDPLIRSLAQIPLDDLLQPSAQWSTGDIRQIQDNRSYIRARLRHQRYLLIDRSNGELLRIDDPQHAQFPFDQIEYQLYRSYRDGQLPRRFRIFQPSAQTDIFLLLQELQPLTDHNQAGTQWPVPPPREN
jgi:hypothetical protein